MNRSTLNFRNGGPELLTAALPLFFLVSWSYLETCDTLVKELLKNIESVQNPEYFCNERIFPDLPGTNLLSFVGSVPLEKTTPFGEVRPRIFE